MDCIARNVLAAQAQRWIAALVAVAAISCATEVGPSEAETVSARSLSIDDVTRELGPGDRGPDVAAVYGYLRQYGYFPNPELEPRYLDWAPVVEVAPPDPSVFGAELEAAVSAFQGYAGVEQTGFVDEATLEIMKQPRCAAPENEHVLRDPSEKWDIIDGNRTIALGNVTWFVRSCAHDDNGDEIDDEFCSTARAQLDAGPTNDATSLEQHAFNMWAAETGYTFTRMASCGDMCNPLIEIRYYTNATVPSGTGWVAFPSSAAAYHTDAGLNHKIAINTNVFWSVDRLRHTLMHEIGHALSLAHSGFGPNNPSFGSPSSPIVTDYTTCGSSTLPCTGGTTVTRGTQQQALMYFKQGPPQALTVDDRLAAITLHGIWKQLPGIAVDIGVGGTSPVFDHVWVTSGNSTVWKLADNGASFIQDTRKTTAGAAINGVTIAVGRDGKPWVISSANQVFRRTTSIISTGDWGASVGTARDIGIGGSAIDACATGTTQHPCVWSISTSSVGGGNFGVRRWNGSGFVIPKLPNGSGNPFDGARISVDLKGRPWVVKADGSIHTNPNSDGSGPWVRALGSAPGPAGCARDIGAGSNGGILVAGCQTNGSDFDLWTFAMNPASSTGQGDARNINVWRPLNGFGKRVAIGPGGRMYVVQNGGAIFRRDAR
jgi:hypothetical protein